MAYSLVRLTLYALIIAVETDLRDAITNNLFVERSPKELLPSAIYDRALSRLIRESGFEPTSDTQVVDYLDYSESIEILSSFKHLLSGPLREAVKVIAASTSVLVPIRNRVMHSRPLEYDDFPHVSNLVSKLLEFPDFLFPALRQTQDRIQKDASYVFSLSLEKLDTGPEKSFHNLPIPDFDETGFLGRRDEEETLVRLCKASPWPIITVLGVGGVGKTALALKVAYSLVDDSEAGFDAVIWSTSKTTTLTVADIKRIDGAIQDSVGVFQEIGRTLVSQEATTDEILEYLNTFKILLILDNLETVLDDKIRGFLAKISSKSKVLITSRVGLGELEYRFPLQSLKLDDAVALLRATAEVRRTEQLTKTSNPILRSYCEKMKSNPLFIKWFVLCVQSGKRPEEVLQNSNVFLDYCLSNVVKFLSDDARLVAKVMLATTGPHTQPVLSFYTGLDGERLQLALQQLNSANFVNLVSQSTDNGRTTYYALSDFPRSYLLRAHPPSSDEIKRLSGLAIQLSRTLESMNATRVASPYSPNSVAIRSRDDVVVAKYLSEALDRSRQKRNEEAINSVALAKDMAPTYAEVHRVDGLVQYFAGNFAASQHAYETAIELDPKSPVVRYWYAGFLLRGRNDAAKAEEQLRIAHELDPTSANIRVEYSRVLAYLFRFDEADKQLEPVIESTDLTTKLMRIAYDGWIQIATRRAASRVQGSDFLSGLYSLEQAVARYEGVPRSLMDRKLIDTIVDCLPLAQRLISQLDHSSELDRATLIRDKMLNLRGTVFDPASTMSEQAVLPKNIAIGDEGLGSIVSMSPTGSFGFISTEQGNQIYFKGKSIERSTLIRPLRVGDQVKFIWGLSDSGPVAVVVEAVSQGRDAAPFIEGVILDVQSEGGSILTKDGRVFSFARTELRSQKHISWLVDMPIEFIASEVSSKLVALSVQVKYTSLLEDALHTKQRVSGRIRISSKTSTYGFVDTPGGSVLVRSVDFRDSTAWACIETGFTVSFRVDIGENKKFLGRDVEFETHSAGKR